MHFCLQKKKKSIDSKITIFLEVFFVISVTLYTIIREILSWP
jgi:hypothetical protein